MSYNLTKEDFMRWVRDQIDFTDPNFDKNIEFVKEIERYDAHAAKLCLDTIAATRKLTTYLKSRQG